MPVFGDYDDYEVFLIMLRKAAATRHVAIHAYALMGNHYHLLVTPPDQAALSKTMAVFGSRYVKYFNRRNQRCGTLWNERYGGFLVEDDRYQLACLRYIDLNPVRAQLVATPGDYRWCSYRVHALGEPSDWLVPHPTYLALGATADERQRAYRTICAAATSRAETLRARYADFGTPFKFARNEAVIG